MRFAVARQEGLDEERVAQIGDDYESSDLTDRDKTVVRFTDAFVLDPAGVSDELRRQMSEHFSAAQIVELTLALSAFLGFSKLRIALGLEPRDMPTRVVATPDVPGRA